MADPHVTEDEQVEQLKAWWKRNGVSVIVGAVVGISAVVGYNLWTSHKETQAESASTLYEQMIVRHADADIAGTEQLGGKIMDEFTTTPYAGKAGLFLARVSVEKKDYTSAASQLRWTIDNAKDIATQHTARIRLGSVLIADGKASEVESLLGSIADSGAFASQYKEVLGDAYVVAGDFDKASSAYQESLNTLDETSGHRDLLTLKLDNAQAN